VQSRAATGASERVDAARSRCLRNRKSGSKLQKNVTTRRRPHMSTRYASTLQNVRPALSLQIFRFFTLKWQSSLICPSVLSCASLYLPSNICRVLSC
jgi:hypothetical protein